jgi:rare lipoprotein A
MHALTAAHPTLPMPSYAYVTNVANNRTILVRINDRGPYVGERMIDLSKRSADVLGLRTGGTGRVRVRYAGPAPLNGDDRRERQFLASRPWNGSMDIAAVESAESAREWAAHRSGALPRSDRPAPAAPVRMAYSERPASRYEPGYGYGQAAPQSDSGAGTAGGEAWSPARYRAALANHR